MCGNRAFCGGEAWLVGAGHMLRALRGALRHVPPVVRSAEATTAPLFQMSVRAVHRVAYRIGSKISQKRGWSYKKMMLKNMLTSLIEHERILTTQAKAKRLVPFADKMITKAKQGTQSAYKIAHANIQSRSSLAKLFTSAQTPIIN